MNINDFIMIYNTAAVMCFIPFSYFYLDKKYGLGKEEIKVYDIKILTIFVFVWPFVFLMILSILFYRMLKNV